MSKLNLEQGIEVWKSLPRNNIDELRVADDYFDNELMPLSLEHFSATQKDNKQKDYYAMMLTLGTSWQPLALSIALLKPQKILVMCTNDTFKLLDRLKAFLGLNDASVKVVFVDRSESYDIFHAMKDFYDENSAYGNICADITGGTKAMSSSAAMMAAVLGMDIYYVESRYLPLYRRPLPGSEEIKALGNPKSIL